MKRICILLALSAIAMPSMAKVNWLWLGENARAEIFVDTYGVTRPGAYVKVWTLLSFKSRQRGGWLSEKRLFLFSCKDQSLEWQQSMYYGGPMGEGEFVHARTLTKYGVGDLSLVELDPSTKDKSKYREAVPESGFIAAFKSLC